MRRLQPEGRRREDVPREGRVALDLGFGEDGGSDVGGGHAVRAGGVGGRMNSVGKRQDGQHTLGRKAGARREITTWSSSLSEQVASSNAKRVVRDAETKHDVSRFLQHPRLREASPGIPG